MTRANAHLAIISTVAFVLGLIFTMTTPASAGADGQIVVTRPDGSAPGKLFTDLTFVPGDEKTEKLVVSQTTEADVTTGIRFESTSPHGPLHDSAEVTISGFGDTVSAPLGEALDTESPFWLGTLSPSDKKSITISVRLPETAGERHQARTSAVPRRRHRSGRWCRSHSPADRSAQGFDGRFRRQCIERCRCLFLRSR
jgi:hypothetical protein